MQSDPSVDAIAMIVGLASIAVIVGLLVVFWGMIFKKAGYSFWMVLLLFLPFVNIVWLVVFVCSKWPIQRELEMSRMGGATGGFPVQLPR